MNPQDRHAGFQDPPQHQDAVEKEHLRQYAERLAKLLDSSIRIPGTTIWIGVDPLLGLLPGIGDFLTHLIGSAFLIFAVKLQVPKIVMVRMAINTGLNTVIGSIPGLGDIFSIWFRSNVKNAKLLRRYTINTKQSSTTWDWIFVISLAVCTLTFVLAFLASVLWVIAQLWSQFL